MSRVQVKRAWALALMAGDALACGISALFAGGFLAEIGVVEWQAVAAPRSWAAVVFLACGILFYLARRGHYRVRHPFWTQARHVGFVSCLALLLSLFMQASEGAFKPQILLTWLLLPVALLTMRQLVRAALERLGLWRIRILVVGDEGAGDRARAAIHSEAALGYEVAGMVDIRSCAPGKPGFWHRLMLGHGAEMLLLATDDAGFAADSGCIDAALRERVPLAVMPLFSGMPVHGCEQIAFFSHNVMLLKFRNNLADPMAISLKRGFDMVLAVAILVMVGPLFALLALLVKSDGGPALFSHTRVGAKGRPFECLKLRTMVTDADAVLRHTLATNPAARREWAETRKLTDDPRITRLGGLLRRTSLDELPQLLNILRGEMSMVGPRPIVQEEIAFYARNIDYYYEMRPGLTGLWQVSGRSETTYERRVELDVWYVKNWTIWNDLIILFMTFSAVIRLRGAR